MSHCLAERSIDHVVLERGEVANSWKTERWDSLRLLTPNWMSRLPGYRYKGDDPDGFLDMPETIRFIEGYAELLDAPIHTHTVVESVSVCGDGYLVSTSQGEWACRSVVVASGACNIPKIPKIAQALPGHLDTITADVYRNPDQLAAGGVLVVGASATGTQIGEELQRSGRPVTIAVGEHIRAPRLYRGRDIKSWMYDAGVMDETYLEVDDINRARNVPSLQLAGSDDRRTIDLNRLTDLGVRLVGRLAGVHDGKAQFSGSLRNQCALSDLKMNRLLDRIDEWITESGLGGETAPAHRFEPTRVEDSPPLGLDLGEFRTVLWATGFRPDYSWLDVPVFDHKGRVRHDGGIVEAPGMYLLGIPFLRRRKSSFIDGVGDDARDLCEHLAGYLDGRASVAPA
ncbi:MAG: NAD(P)-binding domain-containing protein [Acidobacteria bacterium]|nr:NAD(P)-binding domain-containing protein [Acidobacteriota bacterium]NIM62367.1 NAD(P)-binding domain-containing protein [Acidobacteriota bacterium]NIO60676.1 NAD(P)-binding domain-containing protein [Acidobacteriota bacterium]NIQ31742.1 NAD(P)-binding domain-containing protein [Acidobacteriota bacterium]NIQ87047.1 NAD(P)-binding domain-containing protein [Acidobacteriota bacterium]